MSKIKWRKKYRLLRLIRNKAIEGGNEYRWYYDILFCDDFSCDLIFGKMRYLTRLELYKWEKGTL